MKQIEPRCANNELGLITQEGMWSPCCNFSIYSLDEQEKKELGIFLSEEFSLENSDTADEFHKKKIFTDWIEKIKGDYKNAPWVCKINCTKRSIKESVNEYNQEIFNIRNYDDLTEFMEIHDCW